MVIRAPLFILRLLVLADLESLPFVLFGFLPASTVPPLLLELERSFVVVPPTLGPRLIYFDTEFILLKLTLLLRTLDSARLTHNRSHPDTHR